MGAGLSLKALWWDFQIWMLGKLFDNSEYKSGITNDTSGYDSYYVDFYAKPKLQKLIKSKGWHQRLMLFYSKEEGLSLTFRAEDGVNPKNYVISWGLLFYYRPHIVHIFKGEKWSSESIWLSWLKRTLCIHWLAWARKKVSIWKYESGLKEVEHSIDVLRAVIELEDEGAYDYITFISLQIHLYGVQFYDASTTKRAQMHKRIKRHLAALEERGDLSVSSSWRYSSTGRALTTILEYEREVRKQREERHHRHVTNWLTVILALSSSGMVLLEVIEKGWLNLKDLKIFFS